MFAALATDRSENGSSGPRADKTLTAALMISPRSFSPSPRALRDRRAWVRRVFAALISDTPRDW